MTVQINCMTIQTNHVCDWIGSSVAGSRSGFENRDDIDGHGPRPPYGVPSIFCACPRDAYLQRIADNQDTTSESVPVRVRTSGDSGENDGLREYVRAALVAHLNSLKPQNEGVAHCVVHPRFERTKQGVTVTLVSVAPSNASS